MADKILNLLEDIQKGISPSYLGAFNKIVDLDTDSVKGAVLANYRLVTDDQNTVGGTNFTTRLENITISGFTDGDDYINLSSAGTNTAANLFFGQAITLSTTGTLASPLVAGTVYYICEISGNSIRVSTTYANAVSNIYVDLTTTGSGTHTLSIPYMREIVELLEYSGTNEFTHFAVDTAGQVWAKASTFWHLITGNTSGTAYGLAIYKDYLFVFRSTKIDVYGTLANTGGTATWSNDWQTITTGNHPTLTAQDDVLYFGCDKILGSIYEASGKTFLPSDADTYVFQANALDVPAVITQLQELGSNIMLGTAKAIYPWDGDSPSYFDPIILNDRMSAMRTYNNLLYFIDRYGKFFATNGSSVSMIAEFPMTCIDSQQSALYSGDTSAFIIQPKIAIYKGLLYFGVTVSSSTGTLSGVYSFDTRTGALVKEHSSATSNGNSVVSMNCFDGGIFACYDGNLGIKYRTSIQIVSGSFRTVTTYFETGLMTVASKIAKKTFRTFEIVCSRPLTTSQAITLYYRNNLTGTYTSIGSMSFTTDGGIYSKQIENTAVIGDTIQFKVEVTCRTTGNTSPELRAIYVR